MAKPSKLGSFDPEKYSDSMLRDTRIAVSRTLSNIATNLIFRKNQISDACICDRILSVIKQNHDHRMGMNIDLNTKSFSFLDSYQFRTIKCCKACITVLTLSDRTSNSSSCLPSLVNATPRYSYVSTCFNGTSLTYRENLTKFLEGWCTSVLEVLIFIPAMSHAAAKTFNACWKSYSEEVNNTK